MIKALLTISLAAALAAATIPNAKCGGCGSKRPVRGGSAKRSTGGCGSKRSTGGCGRVRIVPRSGKSKNTFSYKKVSLSIDRDRQYVGESGNRKRVDVLNVKVSNKNAKKAEVNVDLYVIFKHKNMPGGVYSLKRHTFKSKIDGRGKWNRRVEAQPESNQIVYYDSIAVLSNDNAAYRVGGSSRWKSLLGKLKQLPSGSLFNSRGNEVDPEDDQTASAE